MYVLSAPNLVSLAERSRLFEAHVEPLLALLDDYERVHKLSHDLPEVGHYLRVCRWPFRKLEYSFSLEPLLKHLGEGSTFLDAGSGVTPLAHAFASRGVIAHACDANKQVIGTLLSLPAERIYGSRVTYAVQDLTATSYPDGSFDAVACVSVLEHIAAPNDKKAIGELFRVLKPGGILVLTVDFEPVLPGRQGSPIRDYARRAVSLAREGRFSDVAKGFWRKVEAQDVVRQGQAKVARSANQCFRIGHLEQDILPFIQGERIPSLLGFHSDLDLVTPLEARRFWDLQPGLYDDQGRRTVLPVGLAIRKARNSLPSE